jgi:uncharacterized membrane protein YoaK (UPF0700 family)
MINKLPKWVEVGGFLLALNAGYINAVGVLGLNHLPISHLTGTSTLLSIEIANGNLQVIIHLLVVMLSFVLGAAASGALVGNVALKLGRRYSLALMVESFLLLAALLLLNQNLLAGHFFASAACGLQNAMTSSYSGAVVRTTHVSGLFTDLGIMLGLRVRGKKVDMRKLTLFMILISGFIIGGVLGAIVFTVMQFSALILPSILTALIAWLYWLYLHYVAKLER